MKRLERNPCHVLLFIIGFSVLALSNISMTGPPARAADRFVKPNTSTPADGELKLVVALFRHGIRSPTPDFDQADAGNSSRDKWPALADWNVMGNDCDCGQGWGYLTNHGPQVVRGLGAYYGQYYKQGTWSNGFNIYLWADSANQRTRETANALADGFKNARISSDRVTVKWLLPACTADPLFHPFTRQCGTANAARLAAFADKINASSILWSTITYRSQFSELYKVLNCFNKHQCTLPLGWVTDKATSCVVYSSTCKSPLQWKGQFSYASSASEAFLLEYANGMVNVGWGRVNPPNAAASATTREMLKLHEFYFDKTDRFLHSVEKSDSYLASIEGSNLAREILDQMKRKANLPTDGKCPRATAQSDFVGLVGHDTNLATVGALLGLNWRFDNRELPSDTLGLPANDALPAGALVFELRQRTDGTYFVRVEYVAQSLLQMRTGPTDQAFRLAVDGPACQQKRPCEIPLSHFRELIEAGIRPEFLSTCTPQTPPQQTCNAQPPPPPCKRPPPRRTKRINASV